VTIKHKCICGAEAEFSGDELLNGGCFAQDNEHDTWKYRSEMQADNWLRLHLTCQQLYWKDKQIESLKVNTIEKAL
jgi:hypothetical protein